MAGDKRTQKAERKRLQAALDVLPYFHSELRFHGLELRLCDADSLWAIHSGGLHILSYWPKTERAWRRSKGKCVPCGTPQKALRLAKEERKRQIAQWREESRSGSIPFDPPDNAKDWFSLLGPEKFRDVYETFSRVSPEEIAEALDKEKAGEGLPPSGLGAVAA